MKPNPTSSPEGVACVPAVETFVLPEYWASYLINGDHSGLSELEKEEVDSFLSRPYMRGLSCVSCSDEAEFRRSNDASALAGNVLEYSFLKSPAPSPAEPPKTSTCDCDAPLVYTDRGQECQKCGLVYLPAEPVKVLPVAPTTTELLELFHSEENPHHGINLVRNTVLARSQAAHLAKIQAQADALNVLVLTPHILAYLEANDPMALAQARAALALPSA